MSLRKKYLRVISEIAPIGAASVWLLLGSSTLPASSQDSKLQEPVNEPTVSERLAAIRSAVFDTFAADVAQEPVTEQASHVQLAAKSGGSQSSQSPGEKRT